jgi:hypothetical protein
LLGLDLDNCRDADDDTLAPSALQVIRRLTAMPRSARAAPGSRFTF